MTNTITLELDPDDELRRVGFGAWYDETFAAIHYRHGIQYRGDNPPSREDLAAIYRHHGVALAAHVATENDDPNWWRDACAAIDRELTALDQMWMADWRAYGADLAESLRRAAAERGLTVEVVETELGGDTPPCELENAELYEQARGTTPLPSSGVAPRDYPPGSCPADVDRAAGRSYLARLAAQQFAPVADAAAPIRLQVDPGAELTAFGLDHLRREAVAAVEAGCVRLIWPHRDGSIWPHLFARRLCRVGVTA